MILIRYEQPTAHAETKGSVVFLAGPTVRGNQPHLISWRPNCVEEFSRQGFEGTLVLPEFSSRTESDKGKEWIPLWEFFWLKRADCILFWIPRTRELIGLTTNFEHGYWLAKDPDKVVYGRPDDAYRIGYNDIMWRAYRGHCPIYHTLQDTVKASIELCSARIQT